MGTFIIFYLNSIQKFALKKNRRKKPMCRHHLVLLTAARWPREGHGICRECQCVFVSVCRCVCVCVFFLIFNFCLLWFVTMKKNTELKKSGNGVHHPTWYTISPLDGNGANLKKNLFSHFFVTISFFSVFFFCFVTCAMSQSYF